MNFNHSSASRKKYSGHKTGAQRAGGGLEGGGSVKNTHKKMGTFKRYSGAAAALLSSGLCSYRMGREEGRKEGGRDGQADFLQQSKYEIWQKGEKKGKKASPLHSTSERGEGGKGEKFQRPFCLWPTKTSSDQVQSGCDALDSNNFDLTLVSWGILQTMQ